MSAVALPAYAAPSETVAVEEAGNSPADACNAIHRALRVLARAEEDQAFALKLFSAGGQLPIVETRYERLKHASSDLREILRRVHASGFAHDLSAAECLKLGYQNLFTADKVTSAVERVLIEARSRPLARFQETGD